MDAEVLREAVELYNSGMPLREVKERLGITYPLSTLYRYVRAAGGRVRERAKCELCGRPAVARKLCRRHYQQAYRRGL